MTSKGLYHLRRMARAINIAAALVCLICVIALCIAPSVDIPDTTLKSLQIILLIMLTLIEAILLRAGTVDLALLFLGFSTGRRTALVRSPFLPIQTNCVQQC